RHASGQVVTRHFLNPSNFGITVTLLLFPSVGIAPPYQFAEATHGALDWLLPAIVIVTGSLLNTKFTGRSLLIAVWVGAFVAQALLRSALHDFPPVAALAPVTGFAFVLFSFYMITDPATTPSKPLNQVVFAVAVAAAYAVFMELHVVFGLFYALTFVTAVRGVWMYITYGREQPAKESRGERAVRAGATS
ncbi:MAG: enediyne biosynthesis protein UnbU, partial [Pseudomonadota bacterium]